MRRTWARAGLLLLAAGLLGAAPPAPVRTAQRVQLTPEPPLAVAPPSPSLPVSPAGAGVMAPGLPGGTPCPVDPPAPQVAIRVRVVAAAAAGQELEYHIRVINRSSAAAHHVTVRNPLPVNAEFVRAVPPPALSQPELAWHLGTLPPCACRQILLVLRPTGAGDIRNCARVQIEHGQCVTTHIARPAAAILATPPPPVASPLTVRKTGPAQATRYQAVAFKVEVANTGPAPLTNVVLTDLLPNGLEYLQGEDRPAAPPKRESRRTHTLLTWDIGTLAPGQQRVFEYSASAKEEGAFVNRAIVTAAGGLRQESASRLTVATPRLEMKMTGPAHRYLDHPADYELTVSNPGSATVTGVTVSIPIPAGAKFASASDGGQPAGGEVRWSLGPLSPGVARTLRLSLAVEKNAEVVVQARASADGGLSAVSEVKTRFQGVAGLTADIRSSPAFAEKGEQIHYTITVENTGTADVTDLRVTALVPPELRFNDATPATAKVQGNTVSFLPATLKPGKANALRYEVFATVLGGKNEARFKVKIEAKELTAGPLVKEASTPIE